MRLSDPIHADSEPVTAARAMSASADYPDSESASSSSSAVSSSKTSGLASKAASSGDGDGDRDGDRDGHDVAVSASSPSGKKVLQRSRSAPNVAFQIQRVADEDADLPTCHWHASPHVGISVSACADEGGRGHQEDTYAFVDDHHVGCLMMANGSGSGSGSGSEDDRKKHKSHQHAAMVGVYDGHSGASCSAYSRVMLPFNLLQHGGHSLRDGEMAVDDERSAFEAAHVDTNRDFNDRPKSVGENNVAGTTAATLLVRKHDLVFANVGDSEACLCYGYANDDDSDTGGDTGGDNDTDNDSNRQILFRELSYKHSAENEKERIEANGGKVVWFGSWRVNGILAVSRSIGDPKMGNVVIGDPYVVHVPRKGSGNSGNSSGGNDNRSPLFAILATDGLWDVLSFGRACRIVLEHVFRDAEAPPVSDEKATRRHARRVRSTSSRRLVTAALDLGSNDNTTAAVVFFD
jgi:serine/threonine protein phosphatase PrpC